MLYSAIFSGIVGYYIIMMFFGKWYMELKANILGGYSRKKVLDYIGSIREQQFKAEEKFRKI